MNPSLSLLEGINIDYKFCMNTAESIN